jgi:eukaryotic-like serine/threonine-protein kinase
MTGHPVLRVDIRNLPLGGELGTGGQGRVLTAGGFLVNGQWPAAVKIYSPGVRGEIDKAALEEIVGLPRQLSPDNARWLYDNTAWPAAIVEDAGVVCGFLMRVVPQEYYFDFRMQTQGFRRKLADIAFLLNSDHYVSSSGITVSEHDRLALLGTFAAMLSRLHDLDIYVGDLSPKNLLFSLHPLPACFILDCDAMRVRGQTVLTQVHTPDWEVPDGEPTATAAADVYKFGLLAVRLFARDQVCYDEGPLAALSPELGRLAALSQHLDPARRPKLGDWIVPLQEASLRASTAPATVSQPTVTAPGHISVAMPTVSAAPPGPAGQGSPVSGPLPRRRRPLISWGLAGVATAIAGASIAGYVLTHSTGPASVPSANSQENTPLSPANQQLSSPSPSPTPSPTPTSVGMVKIGNTITGDPQAPAVAGVFNTYFSSIDNHDYTKALSVFDPSSPLNPESSTMFNSLSNADATSTDSHVVLTRLYPSDGSPVTQAEVTFRSTQDPGYGPAGNPNQTCTKWDLTYTLTRPSDSYLIYEDRGTNTGC